MLIPSHFSFFSLFLPYFLLFFPHFSLRALHPVYFPDISYSSASRDDPVGIETYYVLDGPEIDSRRGEIFHTLSDPPWGPSCILYNGYRFPFPGLKRPGRGINHPPPFSAELMEIVQLYLYSLLWAFIACFRVSFTLTFT